jgi:hypothetical protein
MRKRGLGVLVLLTSAVVVAAIVQDFRFDLDIARERSASLNLDRTINAARVAVANLRAAYAGYVANGQSPDVWMKRASDLAAEIDGRITALQSATQAEDARPHYDAAAVSLAALNDLDGKIREQIAHNERGLAGDMIFSDAIEASHRLDAELAAAGDAEREASVARVTLFRRWRLGATGGACALLVIVALLVYRRIPAAGAAPALAVPAPVVAAPPQELPLKIFAPSSGVDLTEAADVCVDLGRVLDARDVPPLLARAADALEASGVLLWVATQDRSRLVPSLSHGYPDKVLQRMGTLPVDADNATSLAFRSMRAQVVNSHAVGASGAIAVPLITATGCVGVLAAEVKHSAPGTETLAVARILAAQLATVVAPPAEAAVQKAAQA